ncbi:unnamed protein product [Acanthoscelides obtectus]|uniref:Uncharacterized protein n=1 Tax=Acanthoscelides obtectus TaxID=200917 RepID=A0A9P0LEB5_ACAOB|nr:unnamed protein product [Acanthoscelides obtectus]CAK1682020.1 hypothetical protein AOBTE_LOCUS33380 [Acanthoscelides obtectus]
MEWQVHLILNDQGGHRRYRTAHFILNDSKEIVKYPGFLYKPETQAVHQEA